MTRAILSMLACTGGAWLLLGTVQFGYAGMIVRSADALDAVAGGVGWAWRRCTGALRSHAIAAHERHCRGFREVA